jgi:hypothetical protein
MPVQHISYTLEKVLPVPQVNHYSRDGNAALVESPIDSCNAGVLLVPEHENIEGRIEDVDSYLMTARETLLMPTQTSL